MKWMESVANRFPNATRPQRICLSDVLGAGHLHVCSNGYMSENTAPQALIWLATAKFAEFQRRFGQVLPYQAKHVKMQWAKKSSSRCVKHMALNALTGYGVL